MRSSSSTCAISRSGSCIAAQTGLTGCFDAIGPSSTRGQFLAECADAVGASCTFTWVDRAFLESQDIKRWSGPRSLPLWLPLPDYAGFNTRDTSPARAAGLTVRPLSRPRATLGLGAHRRRRGHRSDADEERAALKHGTQPIPAVASSDHSRAIQLGRHARDARLSGAPRRGATRHVCNGVRRRRQSPPSSSATADDPVRPRRQ